MAPWWLAALTPSAAVELELGETLQQGSLVGGGIEDVNHELYGGLYSQMIYGESFEEPAGSSGLSGQSLVEIPAEPGHGLTSPTWSGRNGSFAVSRNAFEGSQSQLVRDGAIANFGLGQQGLYFAPGKDYEGFLWAKGVEGASFVTVALAEGGAEFASHRFALKNATWQQLSFRFGSQSGSRCGVAPPSRGRRCGPLEGGVPELPAGGCYQCSGGLVIGVEGAALLDSVFLQPGSWGRFRDLPVRRDVAEAMFHTAGWQVLRLGGSMCNAEGYRWKHFRGPRRVPYAGFWHPAASSGFRIFETLELCEAAEVECAITINNKETPLDMADFIEYCFGGRSTPWGNIRAEDGREAPYRPFTVEIGNEQGLTTDFIEQVRAIAAAMQQRARQLKVAMPFLAVGQNIDLKPNFQEGRELTRKMLEVLQPFGPRASWDAHIGGDAASDVGDFKRLLNASSHFFREFANATKLVVFEENGITHNLQRALNHARIHIAASYHGDFLPLDTAANGLQVFTQNDNGWDQGQIMMTPDKVWLSPFGWSQAMLSKHAKDFNLPVRFSAKLENVEMGVYRGSSGLGLRLVHFAAEPKPLELRWPLTVSSPRAEAQVMSGPPLAVNGPQDPRHIAPVPLPVDLTVEPGWIQLRAVLPPWALVTVSVFESPQMIV